MDAKSRTNSDRFHVNEKPSSELLHPYLIDDASRMNQTAVAQILKPSKNLVIALQQIRQMLKQAREGRASPVSIAASRHTMGGQTIYPGGTILNTLPLNAMSLDSASDILYLQAGARWNEVIKYLNQQDRSVAVMQSNNSFSIGGSVSANCHGWQPNSPPVASTVVSFRMVLADGSLVTCSRQENAELFALVLGGYGLFGIIIDLQLKVVSNEAYNVKQFVVPSEKYIELFKQKVNQGVAAGMVYGRLKVAPADFLGEAILTVFYRDKTGSFPPVAKSISGLTSLQRTIFRSTVANSYAKELRWHLEKHFGQFSKGKLFSRNQLLDQGVEVFQNRSFRSTDILQEYFIPPNRFSQFLEQLRLIVPEYRGDLLNVTIRNVYPDPDSFLAYARQEVFGLVLLFNQPRTLEGDHQAEAMTQELIDAALELEGCYYLPYRLHAMPQQFYRAYPQAAEFFELKRKYDPGEVFQNQFYLKYK